MNFNGTQCCGVQELSSLSNHKKPDEAMAAFCTHIFGAVNKGRRSAFDRTKDKAKPVVKMNATLYSFYTFTAAIYKNKAEESQYGPAFAKFIREHKLGQVSTCRARPNHAFHPDHKVQAWIWRPSLRTLKTWWLQQHLLEVEAKAAKAAAAVASVASASVDPINHPF